MTDLSPRRPCRDTRSASIAGPTPSKPSQTTACFSSFVTICSSRAPSTAAARVQCGACTVLVDGQARRSCVTRSSRPPVTRSPPSKGSPRASALHPVQQAFLEVEAFQCGYCTAGMVMATVGLLAATPKPSDDDIARRSIATSAAAGRITASSAPSAWRPQRDAERSCEERTRTGNRGRARRASSRGRRRSSACDVAPRFLQAAARRSWSSRARLGAQESGRGRGRASARGAATSPRGCTSTSAGGSRPTPARSRSARTSARRWRRPIADELRVPIESIDAGHGRHRPDAVRCRHVRIADDAAHGAAAGAGGGHGARDADRSRRGAVAGRSRDADGARRPHRRSGRPLGLVWRADERPEAHGRGRSRRRAGRRRTHGRCAGARSAKVNGRDIVTGRHQFTPDVVRPGMLLRPRRPAGRLRRHARIGRRHARRARLPA